MKRILLLVLVAIVIAIGALTVRACSSSISYSREEFVALVEKEIENSPELTKALNEREIQMKRYTGRELNSHGGGIAFFSVDGAKNSRALVYWNLDRKSMDLSIQRLVFQEDMKNTIIWEE